MPAVAGVDLSASPERPTGIAILEKTNEYWEVVLLEELKSCDNCCIAQLLLDYRVTTVVVDAPFSIPPKDKWFREVEREFLRIGGKLLPAAKGPMRKLAERAMKLVDILESRGLSVYETHPYSVLKLAGLSLEELLELLRVKNYPPKIKSKHKKDALVASLVAVCIEEGCSNAVVGRDGSIYYIDLSTTS